MKFYLLFVLILFIFSSCVNHTPTLETNTTKSSQSSRKLTIDVDAEIELLNLTGLLDDESTVVDTPIYIGDNDEVSFKGEIMRKNSPLKIKIGDNDEIHFSGYRYSIKTMELKEGDSIIIKDKEGKVFINMRIII